MSWLDKIIDKLYKNKEEHEPLSNTMTVTYEGFQTS